MTALGNAEPREAVVTDRRVSWRGTIDEERSFRALGQSFSEVGARCHFGWVVAVFGCGLVGDSRLQHGDHFM